MKHSDALRWSQLKVGILVFLAFLILLWVAFNSQLPAFLRSEEALVARFPSADGLLVGAPVFFLGLEAGEVKAVELDPAGDRDPIRVTFTVADDVRRELRADASARVASLGILGDKYLELVRGDAEQRADAGSVLRGRTQTELSDLIEPGRESLARVDAVLQELEEVSSRLARGEGTLGKLVGQDELHARLLTTLEETRETLAELRRTQRSVGMQLASAAESFASAAGAIDSLASGWRGGEGTLDRLARDPALYENVNAAAARLERVLGRIERGDGLLARMLNDPRFAEQVTALVVDLRALLVDMREHPGRYVSFSVF